MYAEFRAHNRYSNVMAMACWVDHGRTRLITGSAEGEIKLWSGGWMKGQINELQAIMAHTKAVTALAIVGAALVSCSRDNTVNVLST